jgi:hypothetical protein
MQAHSGSKHNAASPKAILHPSSKNLFNYWNWLRGERPAPTRQEIDLRSIAPILPWVGIMERQAGGRRHCWRLAGTGIARLWGDGLSGMEVAADWPAIYRDTLVRALDGVYDRRQPFVARLKAVSAHGEEVGIELFAAPVETSNDAAVHTLCTVVAFREPHWLGRIPLVHVELSTLTAIWLGPLPNEIGAARLPPSMQLKLIQGGRDD